MAPENSAESTIFHNSIGNCIIQRTQLIDVLCVGTGFCLTNGIGICRIISMDACIHPILPMVNMGNGAQYILALRNCVC